MSKSVSEAVRGIQTYRAPPEEELKIGNIDTLDIKIKSLKLKVEIFSIDFY